MTPENYREISRQKAKDLFASLTEEWDKQKDVDGNEVFCRPHGNSGIMQWRFRCEVNACARSVLDLVANPDYMFIVDPMCVTEGTKRLEKFDAVTETIRLLFSLPWPMWPRDFVFFNGLEFVSPNVGVNFSLSVSDDLFPQGTEPGVVRGVAHVSGFVCEELDGGKKTRLTYVVQANPRGWLPTWLINMTATDQAKNLSRVREYFNQNGDRNPRPLLSSSSGREEELDAMRVFTSIEVDAATAAAAEKRRLKNKKKRDRARARKQKKKK